VIAQSVCEKFSRLAQISVAILAIAGFALAYVYVGTWYAAFGFNVRDHDWRKIALFGILAGPGSAEFPARRCLAQTNSAFLTSCSASEKENRLVFSYFNLPHP